MVLFNDRKNVGWSHPRFTPIGPDEGFFQDQRPGGAGGIRLKGGLVLYRQSAGAYACLAQTRKSGQATMLRANGAEIERLIKEMTINDPSINYNKISDLTEKARAPGRDYMSPRVLFDARNSQLVTPTRLAALAHVLGVPLKQIVLEEPNEAGDQRSLVTAPSQGLTFVMNFPPELMKSEPIKRLASLPAQTTQQFIDVALGLMSSAGTEPNTLEERRIRVLTDIAKGRLASQLDEIDSRAVFGGSRNPEKEKRYEHNTRLIIEKAIKYFNSREAPSAGPDQTFIDYFLEYCQKVSNSELQELWAQILSAKIQRPDGFSLRTLRLMQDINQDIAKRFVRLCGIVFILDGDYMSIRLNDTDSYLSWAGLSFDDLLVLADYGLVSLGVRAFEAEIGNRFCYFRRSFQAKNKLRFRANPLTAAGRELFALAEAIESDLYFNAVREMFGEDIGPVQEVARNATIA